MIKKSLILITAYLCIAFPAAAWGQLYYYSGTMDAQFEVTHTMEIAVPSGYSLLKYTYPLPENYSLPTNSQTATVPLFAYESDTLPDPVEEDDIDEHGNHNKILTWTDPPAGTITLTVTYTVTTSADWDAFETSDAFPFDSSGLSDSITTFLEATTEVQSGNSSIVTQANTLTSGITTQWEAALAIVGWVLDNIDYASNDDTDALSTYNERYGVCTNYSHLAIALLRAAGIPARFASGDSLSRSYRLDYPGGYRTTSWAQGPHAWIEIYYPSLGDWVPYEPQRDLHHIDTYRVLSGVGRDTTEGGGEWYMEASSTPSGSLGYSSLLSINWLSNPEEEVNLTYIKQTSETTDFALSTAVTFVETHTITASAGSGGSISPSGSVPVNDGSDQSFTITPDSGYDIDDVQVDSVSQGALTSYTFSSVSEDHTIEATFVVDSDGDDDDDGLLDSWEQQIIDYSDSDDYTSIQDVLPGDDFDGDGYTNLEEYEADTDPTDSTSKPSKFMPWLPLLLE